MLELKGIHKTFNIGTINEKKALVDLNLKVNDGDFITVIGGNGAGKSTMLNIIAGVFTPEEGSITIDNGGMVDITKMPEFKRAAMIGRVFQDNMVGKAANMSIE